MRNKLSKTPLIALVAISALSTAFAANIPRNCTEEIITISKGNGFNMQTFMSNLPAAVAKAKLQAKAPFGKPKDSDKTDIGITFGCLKAFPESPSEIASLLKDVGQEAARGTVANQVYANALETTQAQPQYPPPQAQYQYQQAQVQPQYPPPPAQYQYQQAQVQPQYPPPPAQYQYPPPQVFYIYLPQQQAQQTQCQQEESKNFSTGQRWGTFLLNMVPGLGSGVIMNDYLGMGIQMGVAALGITFMAGGWEQRCDYYGCYERPNKIFVVGSGLVLIVNPIFNIIRSYSYDKPPSDYASNKQSGFNLAVLPNRRGEMMPYLTYSKTF